MTSILLGITMQLFSQMAAVEVKITIPATQLPDAYVILYCRETPDCCMYPIRQYDADSNSWYYACKINTFTDKEWVVMACQRGKVAIASFVPRQQNQVELSVTDLPAPLIYEQNNKFVVTPYLPEPLSNYANRINMIIDSQVFTGTAEVASEPSVAYAIYYLTEGYDKWVTSDIYCLR